MNGTALIVSMLAGLECDNDKDVVVEEGDEEYDEEEDDDIVVDNGLDKSVATEAGVKLIFFDDGNRSSFLIPPPCALLAWQSVTPPSLSFLPGVSFSS